MSPRERQEHILIVGGAADARQVGLRAALHGYGVTLYDGDAAALAETQRWYLSSAPEVAEATGMPVHAVHTSASSIVLSADLSEAARGATLVFEFAPDIFAVKQGLLTVLDGLCPYETIFATTSLAHGPSAIATSCGRTDRLVAVTFHGPLGQVGLTEIRPQSETSHATLTRVTDVAHTLETVVVTLKKERRQSLIEGFDVAPLKTALQHAADGVASVEDIDRAWIATMPSSIGPFGMIDALGLDTMLEITRQGVDGEAGALTRYAFLKRYVDEGRLGAKSGEGFYSYPDPAFMRPDFLWAA